MWKIFFLVSIGNLWSDCLVNCTYNIYLDSSEVHNLLGTNSQLFYIRNGSILHNALNHMLTVSNDINVTSFTWDRETNEQIHYKREILILDEKRRTSVTMNISEAGYLPLEPENVAIIMNCSDIDFKDTVIEFRLLLSPSSNVDNVTEIAFRRRKLCHSDMENTIFDTVDRAYFPDGFDSARMRIFYVVLCLGCSLFTLLIVCFLAYIVSKQKSNGHNSLQTEQQMRLQLSENERVPYILNTLGTLGINSGTSTSSNMSHVSLRRNKNLCAIDSTFLDLHEKIPKINIERKRIRLQKIELEGTYGRVFYGTYSKEDGSEEDVMVKTVMDFASAAQVSLFLKEGLSLYGLKHKNIISVMAVSVEENMEPFVIYHRQGFSNLKKFLQKCKHGPEGVAHTLTTQEVVEIALQIISGIHQMHKKKILHKDLATRNCLIDSSLNVKIADNALSRDLFPNDYHCLGDNDNRPVKWLAIESLVYKTFSTASDVWSYGVTLWELTTLAQQPYIEVDPFEIELYLKDGYRLSQPVNCPDELFAVMAYCWAMSADERPTFSQLQTCLQDFHNQLNKFV